MPFAQLLLSSMAVMAPSSPARVAVQALRKPSGALSVSVECQGAHDVEALSAALRKAGTATLWASEVSMVSQLAAEQRDAAFDFPGPCPVVFHGEAAMAEAAVQAGADAVVLDPSERELAGAMGEADVIWRVSSADELQHLLDTASDADAPSVLLASEAMQALTLTLTLALALTLTLTLTSEAMQADEALAALPR